MKRLLFYVLTSFSSFFSATHLAAVPKAVVFDFGGVMTGESNRAAVVNFFCETFQLSPSEFKKANLEKKEALKAGKSDEEFWLSYAQQKGIALPISWRENLKHAMKEALAVNPKMYALVAELKARQIPVAMLSNIDKRLATLVREFGYYEPFELCLLSYELGVQKPDPKIYQILVEKLQLPPSDVVFIDDREENIDAAKTFGIDAILFLSPEQLRDELKRRDVPIL